MKTWLIRVVLSALLLAAVVACVPARPAATPAPTPAKVRIGYLLSDLHHIAHVAAADPMVGGGRSLYEQNGLTVEVAQGAPYANGGVEMDHFASGDVDIGLLGLPPAIIKHLNAGINTIVVGQVNEIGSSLIVPQQVSQVSDLVGKTVAAPSHSSIQFFLLLNLLQQRSIDPGRLTIIDMSPQDMRARLEKGDIAGYIAWEPFPSDAVVNGAGKVLATSQDIWPNHPDCVILADRTFADQNPEVVRSFLKAYSAATKWVNDALARPDSKEYAHLVELGAGFTGRDPAVVKEAYEGIHYKTQLDAAFQSSFTEFTDKLIQFKIVPAEKVQERGYKDAVDFATKYIRGAYLEALK